MAAVLAVSLCSAAQPGFTLEQVMGHPFAAELTSSASGRIAWTLNENGHRNIWVAEAPSYAPRKLTAYDSDSGQEITSVQISRDGQWVVYVRGGDFSSNWDDALPVNALHHPVPPKVQIHAIPFAGGSPKVLGEGVAPAVAPASDRVAFVKERGIWLAPIDGAKPARRVIGVRGENGSPTWSPDGSQLAFVSSRNDHAFIGVYEFDKPAIRWLAPGTGRDSMPRWSPDGKRLAFVRRPGAGGAPEPILEQRPTEWGIWIADVATGEGRVLWSSPRTLRGSLPTTHGTVNLHWAARGRIVFLSYQDGWPHLYSIAESGGEPLQLTRGGFMVEHVRLSFDGATLLASGNTGPDTADLDRRHLLRVAVDRAGAEVLTPGAGIETAPVFVGGTGDIAFIAATAQRPGVPAVLEGGRGEARLLGLGRIPPDFPASQLTTPRQVVYRAPDGMAVHAQLFDAGGSGKRPAIVYIHGGPQRQMLLGWHYLDYYANAYALNQYLASRGYVVLSVNYRLGIGYGWEFHHPPGGGAMGASEYQDIRAAGEWLRGQPQVDPARIGVYGGSYGGYLTALALGRDSDLFAVGVDIHGVHDRTYSFRGTSTTRSWRDRYAAAPDAERAIDVAWQASPVSAVGTWKSPVLLIHADDDRNVAFAQTVDLVRRLAAAGVPHEEIVIPDDTHHFLLHANLRRVNAATAAFFERHFHGPKPVAAGR